MQRPAAALVLITALVVGAATFPAVSAQGTDSPREPGEAPAARGAQGPDGAIARSDSLRVFLLTFGPGEAVWERFGHNALWIHDPEAGTDVAYHYGLFDMSEEGFMLEFLRGRMLYSMGTAPANWLVDAYRGHGRGVTVQELALDPAESRDLQEFLEWNMRPENRVYRYDYFRDNCSTRIRDALDLVLDGRLREVMVSRLSALSYRGQAVALTAEDGLLTTGMDLGLGPLADQPITRWDLAYIPMRLRDDLRDLTVEREGGSIPLVASERELPALGRPDQQVGVPPRETSTRGRALRHLLVGLLLGALIAGAGWLATRRGTRSGIRKAARWTLAVTGTLWGLLTGVLGVVLLALWTLTDHEFAWRNENLLQANPLALGLVVLVPLAVLTGRRARATRGLAFVLAGLSIVGLILHPLPLTPQANQSIIALALPVHLALAWATQRISRHGSSGH